MKKNILFLFIMGLLLPAFAFSQVGVNTPNPNKPFHVDGAGDTTTTGENIKDDFVVKNNGSVGVGTLGPSDFSALEIVSDYGFRLPQLTTTKRDSLFTNTPSTEGLMLFNTSTKCVNISKVSAWIQICCTPMTGDLAISPASGSELVPSPTQEFTVSGVTGATRYEWYFNNTTGVPTKTTEAPTTTITYDTTGLTTLTVRVVAKGCGPDKSVTATYTFDSGCTPPSGSLTSITVSPSDDPLVAGSAAGYYTFTANAGDGGITGDFQYLWMITGQSGTVSGGLTGSNTYNTYAIEDSSGKIEVSVSIIGNDCQPASEIRADETFNVCKPVSGTPTIAVNPALATDKESIFSISNIDEIKDATTYEWYLNGSPVYSSDTYSDYQYTPPSGVSSVTVTFVAKGCNNSQVTSGTQTFPVTTCNAFNGTLSISPSSVTINIGEDQTFNAKGLDDYTGTVTYLWEVNGKEQSSKSSTMTATINDYGTNVPVKLTITDECENKKTATASVNTSTWTCKAAGHYLIPGTQCKGQYNCVYNPANQTLIRYEGTCPSTSLVYVTVIGQEAACTDPSDIEGGYTCPY